MAQLFVNNWTAETTAALLAADSVAPLSRGDLPATENGDWMLLTLSGPGGVEIVRVVKHTAGAAACSVQRGQEGTAALAWPSGTKVELRLTAGTLAMLNDAVSGAARSGNSIRFTRLSGAYFDVAL
jgi:hypothetical protein